MDIFISKKMRNFILLAQTNNIARAAEKIHMTASPFGKSIAALEEQLTANRTSQSQCGSDYLALQTLQEEEGRLEQALEEKMERWEYLSDLAQRIAAQ